MKNVLLLGGGFVAGIIATIIAGILINGAIQPNDGLSGLTLFPEKGECILTSSKNKSCETPGIACGKKRIFASIVRESEFTGT